MERDLPFHLETPDPGPTLLRVWVQPWAHWQHGDWFRRSAENVDEMNDFEATEKGSKDPARAGHDMGATHHRLEMVNPPFQINFFLSLREIAEITCLP